jgi:hypothetical protein
MNEPIIIGPKMSTEERMEHINKLIKQFFEWNNKLARDNADLYERLKEQEGREDALIQSLATAHRRLADSADLCMDLERQLQAALKRADSVEAELKT